MKRHPGLRGLSSDHQLGLVHARRLIKAQEDNGDPGARTDGGAAETARAFLAFWTQHTTIHFREEEEVLLPAFARYGSPSHEAIVRMLVEHVHIRRLAADLENQLETSQPILETMHVLGEMLRGHIRHEEEVVFPLVESVMPEEALQGLPAQLESTAGG